MNLSHPDHPIWSLARILVYCLTSLVAIYIGATEFDIGELKGWSYIVGSVVGGELLHRWQITNKLKEDK